jgi:hypothetical protein
MKPVRVIIEYSDGTQIVLTPEQLSDLFTKALLARLENTDVKLRQWPDEFLS